MLTTHKLLYLFCMLSLSLISTFAQTSDTHDTLNRFATLERTLDPDETYTHTLDLPANQHLSMFIVADAAVAFTIRNPDEVNLMEDSSVEATHTSGYSMLTENAGQHTITVTNTSDHPTTIRLYLTILPYQQLTVGETLDLSTIDIEEGISIRVTGNADIGYVAPNVNLENIAFADVMAVTAEGTIDRIGIIVNPVSVSNTLFADYEAIYLILTRNGTNEEALTAPVSGTVRLQEVTTQRHTLQVGGVVTDRADRQFVYADIELTEGDDIRFAVLAGGIQLWLFDESGTLLSEFGHASVPYRHAELDFVAPADGTYTLHIAAPDLYTAPIENMYQNVLSGPYTVMVLDGEYPRTMAYTTDFVDPFDVTLTSEDTVYLGGEYELYPERDEALTLSITRPDDATGDLYVTVTLYLSPVIMREPSRINEDFESVDPVVFIDETISETGTHQFSLPAGQPCCGQLMITLTSSTGEIVTIDTTPIVQE